MFGERAKASAPARPARRLSGTGPARDGRRATSLGWSGSWAHWTGRRWINAFRIGALPTDAVVGLVALATIPRSASIWAAGWVGRTPTNSVHDSLIGVWGPVP